MRRRPACQPRLMAGSPIETKRTRSCLKMRVLRAGAAALLLGLTLAPVALAQGPLELTTQYPAVTADPGSTVEFPVLAITDVATRVDLSATAPDGWTVRMRGGGST